MTIGLDLFVFFDKALPTKVLASFNAVRSGILNSSIGVGTVIINTSASLRSSSSVNSIFFKSFNSFLKIGLYNHKNF